jgi:hypothetical protein
MFSIFLSISVLYNISGIEKKNNQHHFVCTSHILGNVILWITPSDDLPTSRRYKVHTCDLQIIHSRVRRFVIIE